MGVDDLLFSNSFATHSGKSYVYTTVQKKNVRATQFLHSEPIQFVTIHIIIDIPYRFFLRKNDNIVFLSVTTQLSENPRKVFLYVVVEVFILSIII